MTMTAVRPAAVAGLFYPDDARQLRAQMADCLADAGPAPTTANAPKLLIVPHAGVVYSGPIAARAYARLVPWRDRIRRVVLLGPAHRVPVRSLALPSVQAFETPLGRVTLDAAAMAWLDDLPQVVRDDRAHAFEHSLEVQLPFLQSVLDDFTLVPLVVGDAASDDVTQVLDRLWDGDETLIVVSTDLSHYLSHDEGQRRDAATVQRMLRFDHHLSPSQACGAFAVNGALAAAQARGLVPRLLDLRNSGDTAGDRRRVVGYVALAFEAPSP